MTNKKQSNDMIQNDQSTTQLQNNISGQSTPTLVRRVMLLLAILLAGVIGWGSRAVAQDVATLWTGSTTDQITLSGETLFNGLSSIEDKSKAYLNIYTNDDGLSVFYADWGNNTGLLSGETSISQTQYYIPSLSCYSVPFSAFKNDFVNRANQWTASFFIRNSVSPIIKITYYVKPEEVDAFINEPASFCDYTNNGGEQIARDLTTKTIDLSGASLAGVKYARIYLADDKGKAVDPTELLSVSYGSTAAVQAGNDVKNGVYVYDGDNDLTLSDISITLNAGAGNFTKYQIVCLLANDISTATPNDGTTPLTQEPKWQEEYTYTFTYPIYVQTFELDESILTETDYVIDNNSQYCNQILNFFGKTAAQMASSWYGRWYVTDASGNIQSLSLGTSASTGWTIAPRFENNAYNTYEWNVSGNIANASNNQDWYVNQALCRARVFVPSSGTFDDYQGYRLIFEATDDYTSGTPVMKLRYIFIIPSTAHFEYDGTIASSTPISQELSSRTATSVTLDWTEMTTTGVKYARFFVVDANGDPVDATALLSVNGSTLCDNPTSGYYVYNDGNNITMPTVTLSASSTAALLGYKVKCWLATATTNIVVEGSTVTEEPDITNEYVYSFTKPAPTTVNKTGTIAWGASMQADASDGAPADWDVTWVELSKEQRVVWYVTDGTTKQPLALGTAAQSGTWVLSLPTDKFSVSSNEAVLTGQTTFTATEWATWGQPALYAPTDAAYADVHGYNVVCEVYETAAGTVPNVRYTFSFTKDFLGELKSGVTATTVPVVLADANAVSYELTGITLPTGAKYARFYLTDGTGTPVDPTGKLTVSGTPGTVSGHAEYGYYIYNESGISTAPAVTLTLTDAKLNLYKVVMVTSADNAVTDGGAVVSEPDWDTQTTWSFKYPVSHTEETGTVEWSPVSMTVPLDIDALKGSGYEDSLTDYHVVWTVSVGGAEATPATGSARQARQWTMSVSGNNATFYAPTGQTFADMDNVTFIARLYETATGENDDDKSLTYTVSIDRSAFLGQQKSTFTTDGEPVELDDADATSVTVPLSHAVFSGAKYARVWLTQDGTPIIPTGKLALPTGMTAFGTNHDAVYGYFLYNESGISLSDVTLTLAAGTYPDYQVHVTLSVDAPIGYTDFARADAPRRAPSLNAYEPDYDYEYIFSFVSPYERIRLDLITDAQLGDNTLTLNIWDTILAKLGKTTETFFQTNTNYTKWYVEDADCNRQPLHNNSNVEDGIWTTTKNNQSTGTVENDEYYWDSTIGNFNQYYHRLGMLDFKTPSGTTLENFRGYRFICEVSDEFDGTNAVPKVIYWIPIPDHFVGKLKTGTPIEETVILEEDTKTYTLATELQTQYNAFVTAQGVTDANQIYLRLYAANVNGTLADDQSVYTFDKLPTGFAQIDQGWAYLGPALTADQIAALADVTVSSTQNLYDTGRKVGLVMAKAPFDERFYPTDAATVGAILNEPKWDYQYLLRFDQFLTTDGPTMIEETVTVRPGNADAEGRYTFNIADIVALSAGAKGFDAKYMRWYLADSNGNIINPQTYTQGGGGPGGNQTRWLITDVNTTPHTPELQHDHNDVNQASDNAKHYGQMWWLVNGNTVEFDDLSFKVTTPMVSGGWGGYYHDDLQNYQVVVFLSDNDDESMLTQTTGEGPAATNTVTKEPTPDYKITIKFNSFFGDLAADATEIEQAFRQPLEDWNEACADGAREYVISFDYAAKTVTMAKADGSGTPMTKNMTDEEYAFWRTFTNNTGTVPYETNFYFRWFLRNKATGEVAQIQNSIVSADGGSALQDVIQYNANNWMGTTTYYRVGDRAPGSKYFCNYFTDQGKDLGTLLRVKLDGSPTGDDCFSLPEYDLVLLLNSTDKGEGDQYQPWGETQHYCLVREPETFNLQYTFHFTSDFEAENIDDPTLKTKYKTLIYDPVTRSATPTILNNWPEVVAALPSSRDEFAQKGYVRWYLVSKATGQPIPMDGLTTNPANAYTSLGNQYGYYRYKFDAENLQYQNNGGNHQYDPTITLPEGMRYQDVRIVGVVTTLTEPQEDNENLPKDLPAREPRQMQVKYIYDLVLEETLRDHQPFIHYHGIHYPDYHRSFEDSREFIGPDQPQDLPDEGSADADIIERVWDYGKNAIYDPADNSYEANRIYNHGGHNPDPNSPDYTTRNIRQKTHTKEYNYYLLLADGQREALKLPYQDYLGGGNDTEPMAYIRWYDWKTDKNSDYLTPSGDADSRLIRLMSTEGGADPVDRGWYNIMLNANPTRTNVGIDFVAPEGFSNMTEEIVIACDVSRYMDGLDDSKQYLVHEPTLSMRYIYHILPAKVLAEKMVASANEYFNPVINTLEHSENELHFPEIENYEKTFHLMEYNGRTVVSLNGTTGNFSLRTSLTEIDHYYVKVGEELKPCNNLQWYAYYEYQGHLYRLKVKMPKEATDWTVASSADKYNPDGATYHREEARLAIFELKDFWGDYEYLGPNENHNQNFQIQPGQFIHLVACLGYKDPGSGVVTEVPTVSTEVFFVDAAPQALGSEDFSRTDYNMSTEYKHAVELDFDDFFDDPTTRHDKPLNSFDNYAKIPILFADAQYGFCYPSLYGQCATDWYLLNGHWEGFGFAPLHGDYTLLKSMNMPGVSQTRGETFDAARYQQAMYTTWYTTTPLYDVGHERASGKADSDTQDYGSFLYVDAAEQSRTIGRLEFDAQLCSGAEIYYTAYIADMTDAVRYGTDIPNTTPQVRFRVYTYNTKSGYPMGTVVGDEYLDGYNTSETVPVISFVTGDIYTEGATEKGKWYQVYGYSNLPSENRAFLEGDSRHFYVEVDNFCENTYGADYAVDQITFYTSSASIRIAQISDVCDDEKGVKMRISALANSLLPHFGQGQDREIFYRIYPYDADPNKTDLEADEAITGQNVYCHEHATDDGDRGNLYGAVPFHVGYDDGVETNYDNTLYASLEALLEAKKDLPEYQPKYGFYKDGDEVYYLLDERYFELTPGQEYFVSLYALGSYKPGGLEGWGNPYGNHTCTAYSNNIMPRTMFIELTDDSEVSEGLVDMGCGRTTATKDFGVRVRYPLESGGYQTYANLPFDFFMGTKTDINEAYLKDEHGDPVMENYTDDNGQPQQRKIRLKDALAHFRGLKDGDNYKYPGPYTTVPTDYENEDEHEGKYYQILKEYVEVKQLLRLEAKSTFTNKYTLEAGTTEVVDVAYLALPLYPQIDEDKEICSPITMVFHLDPTGGAPLMELGFDDVKYPESYKKRGVRLGLEQIAKMRDEGYMLHIPISNYHDKKKKEDPNALYFENAVLKLSATNDPQYLDAEGNITQDASQLIVTTIVAPGADGSSNEEDDGTGVYVSNNRMYLPLSFTQDSDHPEKYVTFKEGYWYEVSTSYYDRDADALDYEDGQNCFADLFIVFKVVPEFATWDAQPIGTTHLYNVSWHNDLNWKRSTRDQLYKDAVDGRTQNTNTAAHPNGYDNDGEGTLSVLNGDLYNANPNPGFVPMKFTYVTLLTGNHAPSLINEARTTVGAVQTGGYLIDKNATELMTDTSPMDNKESSKATDDIRYDMLVRYGSHDQGGEGCFGHRSKTKTGGVWGWRDDKRTDMTQFNTDHKAFDVEKFYGNICKEIYFKPEAELLRQQRLTYEKAWVEKELVANKWYLAASPLKGTYAGDMYVPTTMEDLSMETPVQKSGRQMTEAFQPISFSLSANTVTGGTATSTPAYSRTKYPIYQRSWREDGSRVYTKENDMRATNYSANLEYQSVSETFLEWSHTYNDVQVPYSTATTSDKVSVPMGFSIRAHKKDQKDGSDDVPALIRLPKADTTYQYYDWNDAGSNPAGGEQTVSKPDVTLTNSFNGSTWNYTEPMQYRFITDDASKEQATQGAMEFDISDVQVQDGYVLVGNPHVASLNMGEFFNGNPRLSLNSGNPSEDGTTNYSYWTYEGNVAKAFLVDKTTQTHVVSTADGDTYVQDITYAITSGGTAEVGTIRPLQAFFVKKGDATIVNFTRDMTIDGNFPVKSADTTDDGNGGTTVGGARRHRVTLTAATTLGTSSATVWQRDGSSDGYNEGEDVETLFHSNLVDMPMVFTVAGGQAVSIDQRPQLDMVPFGVSCAASSEMVQLTVDCSKFTVDGLQFTDENTLYIIDAVSGSVTEVGTEKTFAVQPNDYGRYFLTTDKDITGIRETLAEEGIVVSVRDRELTVRSAAEMKSVRVLNATGAVVANVRDGGLETTINLAVGGIYIVEVQTAGSRKTVKIVVR